MSTADLVTRVRQLERELALARTARALEPDVVRRQAEVIRDLTREVQGLRGGGAPAPRGLADVEALRQDNERLERRYASVTSSLSWRITRPLRWVLRRVRRCPGRP